MGRSCDIDEHCEKTYKLNFGDKFDASNIFNVNPHKLPHFDVLCAGFPCQPFSIAGKQLGFEDVHGTVLFQLLHIISSKKPSIIILENVANFISHDTGSSYKLLAKQLNNLGYAIHTQVLDSAYFGVPQHRKRAFIVAFQETFNTLLFSVTSKRTQTVPFRDYVTQGDYSIPISKKWEQYIDLYTGRTSLAQIKFEVPKTRLTLERANNGVHLEDCVLQMRSSGIRACSLDAPLPTFAVSHSGGGAMIPVYTAERRHLNLTEIKRVMGFPDDFRFEVSRTHAIKQLANAVYPPVISALGQDIGNFLGLRKNLLEKTEARTV